MAAAVLDFEKKLSILNDSNKTPLEGGKKRGDPPPSLSTGPKNLVPPYFAQFNF